MTTPFENFVNIALGKSVSADVTLPTADEIPVFTGIGRQVTGKTIVELGIAKVDDLAGVATSGSYNDLSDKPTIPAAQVNADWGAGSGVAQILNKPTLGTAAAQNVGDFATAAQGTKADSALQAVSPAITAGTYGSASAVPVVVVNAAGQVTDISVVALSVGTMTANNTAFGLSAQTAITSGLYNMSFGYESQKNLTTGSGNVAIGHQAQKVVTTGGQNIAIGYQSQDVLTTGSNNISGGNASLGSLTTGSNNIAIGNLALSAITTGSGNVAIGAECATAFMNGDGSNNTFIGHNSGKNAAGSNNVIIGCNTGGFYDNNVILSDGLGTVVARHDAANWTMQGAIFQNVSVGTTLTLTANSQLVVEVTSNSLLTFKLKGTDGTTRTATLTLT